MSIKFVRERVLPLIKENGLHQQVNDGKLRVSLNWVAQSPDYTITLDPQLSTLARTYLLDYFGIWWIVLNSSVPKSQQRLALAHELGHIFLGHTPMIVNKPNVVVGFGYDGDAEFVVQYPPRSDEQEQEADQFAAYLLVPAEAVKKAFAKGWNRKQLAGELGVPVDLVDLRIKLMQTEM